MTESRLRHNGHKRSARPKAGRLGIFGAGGSGREIAWLAQQCWGEELELTFLVDQASPIVSLCNGIPVSQLAEFAGRFPGAEVTVAVGDPALRRQCVDKCSRAGLSFLSLIHPRVEISPWVSIGQGTVICAGSIVTTNISLGQHVHVNVDCSISHDVEIGEFTTLSPGVHIAGWVTVGRGVFMGTGAIVMNGSSQRRIHIEDGAVIGAGACVIDDVDKGATVVGVPARKVATS